MNNENATGITIDFVYSPVINFALQQNHVPVIRRFVIKNQAGKDLQDISVQLSCEPDLATPSSTRIALLQNEESIELNQVDIKLSAKYLSELTEKVASKIQLSIQSGDQLLFKEEYSIDVLAFDEWQGISILPEMISSFVTPNNPQISRIISKASEFLNTWTGSPSMDEYQTRNPDRVKKQMAAVFEAIREYGIVYCTPPASFEETGQRIRMIDMILSQKLGTCLDMALLYASCLEAIGIRPIIIIVKGHAFAGAWLIDDAFADSVNDDPALLSKRIAEGINEILLVETTCMNSGKSNTFDEAIKATNYHLVNEDNFLLFVDVHRSRFAGIKPLPQRIKTDQGWEFVEPHSTGSRLSSPEELSASDGFAPDRQQEVSKQQLWERKLLDLSLRNNLLNTRITKSTIQLISVSLSKLEDALAAGDEFQVLSKPTDWENPLRKAGIYQALNQTDPMTDLVKNELLQKHLRTYLTEGELVGGLTNLYRLSRLSLEENGANTLYLSLGLLKWFETPTSEQPRFAPILLLPVEIIRKSAMKGYVIRSREEETIMNITLLEMLRQDFKITIPGLDPLPRDESGVDVKKIFNIIRKVIMPQKGWDVEEQAILGTFSFSKFIMWNDIHNNADKLIQNKIVSSLILGKAMWDVEWNQFTAEDLDKQYHPSDLVLPISADSSQLEAVCASGQEKSFILHGPPGTGKSQTITNIIANALYNGKKVLFVAEKMAALTVVQRRLEAVGLAPFSLELHSNKSKKSYLLEQLKRTSEITSTTPPENFKSDADRIHLVRSELNNYVEALHKKYHFGYSLYEALSGYASIPEFNDLVVFDKKVIESLSDKQVAEWTEIAEELRAAGSMIGHPHNHALTGIMSLQYSLQIKGAAIELLKEFSESLDQFEQQINDVCDTLCIIEPVKTRKQTAILNGICSICLTTLDLPVSLLGQENIDESVAQFKVISEHAVNRDKIRNGLLAIFQKEVLHAEAKNDRRAWLAANAKWFIPKYFGQQRVLKPYKALAIAGNFDKTRMQNYLDTIIEYQQEQQFIEQNSGVLASLLGPGWQDREGAWEETVKICDSVLQLNGLLDSITTDPMKSGICRKSLSCKLKEGFKSFLNLYKDKLHGYQGAFVLYQDAEKKLQDLLNIDFDLFSKQNEAFLGVARIQCNQWKTGIESLRDWVGWNQTKNKAINKGLQQLVDFYENGNIQNEHVVLLFLKSIYRNCADFIISQDEHLSTFNGKMFEEKIRKFRELNLRFEQLTKEELYAKLASRIPSFIREAASSSEIGILQRNIRNNGRGTSIRKLFDTIPTLLTRICPCMLMSPISVAQYIDVNNFKFDLIVFDEASQMPTCEAVGAIARGKHLIVVGDPKQMPPTSFFTSNNLDEENLEKEDLESVLDDCLALSLPSKHLQWHYRSKHESLITFSNSQFYENSLLTFPSPDDQTTKVKFVSVAGYYDRGKTRQNSFEARAVVDEIIHRLSDPVLSKKSIGVVTFSSVQQTLVDDLLNEAFMLRPDLELIATETHEPIFIKNLENVQGDERDVILFSVGYGPDKEGKVNLNFGPLNREGGWRRLNVAVSRARYEMKVFSTLKADQIDITRTAAKGVAGLKAFLDFAEKGKAAMLLANGNGKARNTGVVDHIAKRLNDEGILVKTNIGCSGFKIDIGITNPANPSEYILGILCDGNSYKESKTAKDREIVQSEVLRLLGWQIHKVWSCDWWDDPEKVLNEIKKVIKEIKLGSPVQTVPEIIKPVIKAIAQNHEIPPKIASNPLVSKYKLEYKVCTLNLRNPVPQPELFLQEYNKKFLIADIRTVLEIEAPISKELLCRRVLSAWSMVRIGSRIDAWFDIIFREMDIQHTDNGNRFFWKADQQPENYLNYRISETDAERREASDISPEEVSNVVKEILEQQISLNRDELVREVARTFGFGRIGNFVEFSMLKGIDKAVKREFAKIDADRVYLVE